MHAVAPRPSSSAAQPSTPSAEVEPEAAPAPEPRPWPPADTGATSDFCIDGVSALDESCCYALPAAPTQELLIYLHGTVPPTRTSQQKTNFETVVSRASRRAGVAALMPRGRQGLAPKGQATWWGWPTSGEQYRALARELIADLADKRQKLEALTSQPFTRLYLAGSSSGAYFVVALALNGDLPAHGFAAISGGAIRPGRDLTGLTPAPFYVGYGSFDTVSAASRSLAAHLHRAGWPVLLSAHALPHGTAEIYLDEAFAFFRLSSVAGRSALGG
jgi:predicted esterase